MRDLRQIDITDEETIKDLWIKAGASQVREIRKVDRIPASDLQGKIIAGWFLCLIEGNWIPVKVFIEDPCSDQRYEEYRLSTNCKRSRWGLFIWDEAIDGSIPQGRAIVKWIARRAIRQIEYAETVPDSESDQRYAEECRKELESIN